MALRDPNPPSTDPAAVLPVQLSDLIDDTARNTIAKVVNIHLDISVIDAFQLLQYFNFDVNVTLGAIQNANSL